MKSKIALLCALLFCMGASDLLYAGGHHHRHHHRKHRPHHAHGGVHIVVPNPMRPQVQVHGHREVKPRAHCHGSRC